MSKRFPEDDDEVAPRQPINWQPVARWLVLLLTTALAVTSLVMARQTSKKWKVEQAKSAALTASVAKLDSGLTALHGELAASSAADSLYRKNVDERVTAAMEEAEWAHKLNDELHIEHHLDMPKATK